MKIYFAGANSAKHIALWAKAGMTHSLISVVDLKAMNARSLNPGDRASMTPHMQGILSKMRKQGINIFLDCGAFTIRMIELHNRTAATKERVMTLQEYCIFVQRYHKYFEVVAALDVIGDPEKSYSNYMQMCREGLDYAIPAWHCGAPLEYIDKYVSKTDYIAIGGLASLQTAPNQITSLKGAYIRKGIDRIRQNDPKCKIHLYGVTDLAILRTFGNELESVDSTKWLNGQKFAKLFDMSGRMETNYQRRIRNHSTHSNAFNVYQMVKTLNQINDYNADKLSHRLSVSTG